MTDPLPVFEELGIALVLGLLVGLQREHSASGLVGLRSFALITVWGTVAARLAMGVGDTPGFGGWVVAAGLIGVVALLALAHLRRIPDRRSEVGMTTDIAALLMYGVGALLVVGPLVVGIAVGGGVAVLLQFKPELHQVARKLGDEDLRAIMQFVLITCIILPVLPDRSFGPLNVFNPRETWLFVVLLVGINLAGYIAYKFWGQRAGILLGGVLGGAISSTATTMSYSRQARAEPKLAVSGAIVIALATAVLYLRVVVLIAAVGPDFLPAAGPQLLLLAVVSLAPPLWLWYRVRGEPGEMPQHRNPTQLKTAVFLGAMYTVVLVALAGAREWFGQAGPKATYVVAALSGLTDVDALTLSTARLVRDDPALAPLAWRWIVLAALSNLAFKAVLAGLLGGRQLLRHVGLLFAAPLLGSLGLLWLW